MKKLLLSLGLFSFLNADIVTMNISEYDFSNKDYALIDVRMPSEYATTGGGR